MSGTFEPILRIPQVIRQETLAYRGQLERFLKGQVSPVAFRAYRVPMGVYEQRSAGKYMVRVRVPAGLLPSAQADRIARLSRTYGNGVVHITTRQDVQIHEVDIADTPDVLEGLLDAALSSRGSGGNTVRNITACPRAGVCPKEIFDVAPYAVAVAEYLLQDKGSFNLPRKFKIAFSGCPDDCALASVADLGFFARRRAGADGFTVYAGGGLGPHPALAVKVEDFVAAGEVFKVAEAVKKLFDTYGDRSNKHKARLRYVLARLGEEGFRKSYEDQRRRLEGEPLVCAVPEIRDIFAGFSRPTCPAAAGPDVSGLAENVLPEKTTGLFTVALQLRLGDIPADDLIRLAGIAGQLGDGLLRTTQTQDLLITSVPQQNVERVLSAVKKLDSDVTGPDVSGKVVACAGAATCKLGLCLSRSLAEAILEKLNCTKVAAWAKQAAIGISGCPNCCGHHYIAPIGLAGRAKRVNGRLMPCYDVLVGGQPGQDRARLAEKVGTVPAKKVPDILARILTGGTLESKTIKYLVEAAGDLDRLEAADDYFYDFGAAEPFSLAGRGPGECGAGVMDLIKLDLDEARQAYKDACLDKPGDSRAGSDALYRAILAGARALLVVFGLDFREDAEVFKAFGEHLVDAGWVEPEARQLTEAAAAWRRGRIDSLGSFTDRYRGLLERVEELFLSLDANLKFTIAPAAAEPGAAAVHTGGHFLDLRGVPCPLNFVKAKLALESVSVGEVLELLLDEGEPVKNVSAGLAEQGQEVLAIENRGEHFSVRVRRRQ
jgi:sulfite reductase (ferredoxin)